MKAGNLLAAPGSLQVNNLNNLGIWLRRRFELTGSIIDLDNSIRLGEEALEATDRTSLVRCNRQIGLSIRLFRRYDRNRSLLDLERAIKILEDTDEQVMDHPLRIGMMHNQARLYRARYQHNHSPSDLQTAFSFAQGAIGHTPKDHPERVARLNNLAGIHLDMFNFSKSLEDLDEAISINNTALESTNPSLRNYTSTLNIRGSLFYKRYLHTGSFDDLEHAKSSYKESWLCVKGKPHERIYAAQQAATILAEHSEWEEAYFLLQPAINLLPLISPHQIQHSDKQYVLKDFPGVASLAAASALQAGRGAYEALEILERGRGVISSLILNLRTDISKLVAQFPQLAEEYISLRNELDSPITVFKYNTVAEKASAQETAMQRRREASVKLEELMERIRANEEFQQFLIEPTVDEFRSAADPDPIVIINVSSYRCDAFIVEKHLVRSIELPCLILSDIQEKARGLRLPGGATSSQVNSMLEWLWEVAMCPILEALGFGGSPDSESLPHVWWIPTGSLSHLPLHAAGRHTTRSGQTVLDYVMSSYSPSLKALIRGRQHASQQLVDSKRDSIVLVSMSQTPGLSSSGDLRYTAKEVMAIEAICPSLRLSPIQPLQRKQGVLSHLQACRIFHFAGHSRSDPSDPSQSSLLLEDWETDPFTVGHLRDRNIQGQLPFLGYLSACSTGAVKVEELVDEGIHLISAFRLAGFRHVIGTLWEVSDETCVDVARIFYETIAEQGLNDRAIYLGIHRSVRRLRDVAVEAMYKLQEEIDHPSGKNRPDSDRDAILVGEYEGEINPPVDMHWVPYVHFGV
jgi:tetratricopeptide (TPR) repeat protein